MRKFIRTRPASPPAALYASPPATRDAPPLKTNGHANGAAGTGGIVCGGGGGGDCTGDVEDVSTLSRSWSEWEGQGDGEEWDGTEGAGARVVPWQDPQFPANWRSLGGRRAHCGVVWMRPREMCEHAEFLPDADVDGDADADADANGRCNADADGAADRARWRLVGGALGASGAGVCVAAGALAGARCWRLWARVAPRQPRALRSGRCRFRFWECGTWRDVWVDDRLPTRAGRLIVSRSAASADFTLPLLEKAYAKWRGGYAALRAGGPGAVGAALRALTGGVVQSFELARTPPAQLQRALEAAATRATLCCAWRGLRLVTVSGLARVRGAGGGGPSAALLVRVRDAAGAPPGEGDGAAWRALSPPDRELLTVNSDPGDRWLSFAEFVRSFPRLELVHIPPDEWVREPALQARRPWRAVVARRRWLTGYNAGGAPPALTAPANPHFHVQVHGGAGECHAVVSVMQRCSPFARPHPRLPAVGFSVYSVGGGGRALVAAHVARAPEVAAMLALPPGRYLVMPHTARPHTDAHFLLRIFTDERTDIWEANEDNSLAFGGALDLEEARALPPALYRAVERCGCGGEEALEAGEVRRALRRVWRWCLEARPSASLCRALVPLGDASLRGALPATALPALVARLVAWRSAWRSEPGGRGGGARRSTYSLRALLEASGARVSNKVAEALVVRFACGGRWLRHEDYVRALAALHLAHARHRALAARHKTSPLTLEEMILMTIYT